jgi:peroxiredoxin
MTTPDKIAEYNRTSFSREEYKELLDLAHLDFQPKLHVGDMAPDFVATDLNGQPVRLSDYRGKKHVVFEFGCITAPIFINDIPELNRLHGLFHDKDIEVLVIYIREGHPAENYHAHTSLEQKLGYARDLQRLEDVKCPILVDSLAGDAHHLYGMRASPVWMVHKDGRIIHKSSWLVADRLELILNHLVRADQWAAQGLRTRWVYSETWSQLWINRTTHERVLGRAGARARAEVVHAFGIDPMAQGRK